MITDRNGSWMAECDACGLTVDTGQRSFQQAINYISRAEGWENRKFRDRWRNYCPQCGQEGDPERDLAGVVFTKRWAPDDE